MTRRLSSLVVALYPRSWRRRYGAELADLCHECLESGESTRLRLTVGLIGSAVVQRLRALASPRHRALIATVALAVTALAALATTTDGLGLMGGASNKGAPAPLSVQPDAKQLPSAGGPLPVRCAVVVNVVPDSGRTAPSALAWPSPELAPHEEGGVAQPGPVVLGWQAAQGPSSTPAFVQSSLEADAVVPLINCPISRAPAGADGG
jgi:hypothetical protein